MFAEILNFFNYNRSVGFFMSKATAKHFRKCTIGFPKNSTRNEPRELQIAQTTEVRILHKWLRMNAYKVQIA